MTLPSSAHVHTTVDGEELIRRVRQACDIAESKRRPRFLYEYVNDFLSKIVNNSQPFSRLFFVKYLPARLHSFGISLLARQVVSSGPHPDSRSFSTVAKLRERNLRGRILAVLPYPIFYPEHGGQFRAHDIYARLSKEFEIIALSFGLGNSETRITPNLWNISVNLPEKVAKAQRTLEKHIGLIASRISLITNFSSSDTFLDKFDEFSKDADVVIFSHPYLFQLESRLEKDQIVVYDCVDVEYDLFKALVREERKIKHSSRVMKMASDIERHACERSDLIFVTCKEQADRLERIYGISARKMHVVRNPIDVIQNGIINSTARGTRKVQLGLDNRPVILYLASWHPPHLKSVRFILTELAPKHLDWTFLILGTVADELAKPYMRDRFPSNVIAYGKPTSREKAEICKAVDVAIDPVTYGSGTEIKILVYMAAGLPVVSTKVGVRGLNVRNQKHVMISDLDAFGESISRVLEDQPLRDRLRTNALAFVAKYDAREIAKDVAELLSSTLERKASIRSYAKTAQL